MELQTAAATMQDDANLFSDGSLEPTAASPALALAPGIAADAPKPGLDSFARRSWTGGRRWPPERWGKEQTPTARPSLEKEESIQALTVPVSLVDRGDVVAIGNRFYCVDSTPQTHPHHEFPRIVLRSLETTAHAAIEFQDADALVSVLRFPSRLWLPEETALAHG